MSDENGQYQDNDYRIDGVEYHWDVYPLEVSCFNLELAQLKSCDHVAPDKSGIENWHQKCSSSAFESLGNESRDSSDQANNTEIASKLIK